MWKEKYRKMIENYLGTKCKSINQLLPHKTFHAWILENRERALLFASLAGIVLAFIIYGLTCLIGLGNDNGNKILQSSLTILALGLPTFFILWLFRTFDVQRQIDKTQGQINKTQEQINKAQEQIAMTQKSINNSSFFECARILIADDYSSPNTEPTTDRYAVALEQLAYLRRETRFDEERIDYLTRRLSLRKRDFCSAQLSGLDLFDAKLALTDLTNANLEQVDLRSADLRDTILERAILTGTNLKGAIYNDKTNFQGTPLENKEARDEAGMKHEKDTVD